MVADKEAVDLSRVHMCESTVSVSCSYEIIAYSVFKYINTARMHTISRQCIPFIYGPLIKRILSKIQPTLPFH